MSRPSRSGAQGFAALLVWARGLDGERVWAIEDCRHVAGSFERFLIARGERVLRVTTKLMADSRRARAGAASPTASTRSPSPAPRCAKDSTRCRPRTWTGPSSICGCSSITANGWSASASRSTTRSNGICTTSGPNSSCPAARCSTASGAPGSRRRLARAEQTMRVRIARDELRRLRELTQTIRALEAEIAELVAQVAPQLLSEPGFGPLTAAKLVGEIAGAERFATDAKLARAAGVAPIPVSSGKTNRHRLDRGGNRQINADHPPHRRHPAALPPRNPGLHRPQTRRRQEHQRSHPLPQTPPRPPHLAPPATSPRPSRTRRSHPSTLEIGAMRAPGEPGATVRS